MFPVDRSVCLGLSLVFGVVGLGSRVLGLGLGLSGTGFAVSGCKRSSFANQAKPAWSDAPSPQPSRKEPEDLLIRPGSMHAHQHGGFRR